MRACEEHIRRDLPASDSYRRLSAQRVDTAPLTNAAFKAADLVRPRRGDPDRELWDLRQLLRDAKLIALRILVIRHDSIRTVNAPVRATVVCAFPLIDGKLEGGGQPRPRQRYNCCPWLWVRW